MVFFILGAVGLYLQPLFLGGLGMVWLLFFLGLDVKGCALSGNPACFKGAWFQLQSQLFGFTSHFSVLW